MVVPRFSPRFQFHTLPNSPQVRNTEESWALKKQNGSRLLATVVSVFWLLFFFFASLIQRDGRSSPKERRPFGKKT